MFEKFIKEIQKFLNTPFRYKDFVLFMDKKKDFLLTKNILENSNEDEYNAMWDTISEIEEQILLFNEDNLVILSLINVQKQFQYHLKLRQHIKTLKNGN